MGPESAELVCRERPGAAGRFALLFAASCGGRRDGNGNGNSMPYHRPRASLSAVEVPLPPPRRSQP